MASPGLAGRYWLSHLHGPQPSGVFDSRVSTLNVLGLFRLDCEASAIYRGCEGQEA